LADNIKHVHAISGMSQSRPTSKKEDIFLIGCRASLQNCNNWQDKNSADTHNADGIEQGGGLVTSLVIILIVAASPYGAPAQRLRKSGRSVAAARSTTGCGISTSANRGDYRGSQPADVRYNYKIVMNGKTNF